MLRGSMSGAGVLGSVFSGWRAVLAAAVVLAGVLAVTPPPPAIGQERVSASDISLHSDNGSPTGVWSDGTTVWVADNVDDKVYAYLLDGGARQADKEFDLHADNGISRGLWSDGTTMWVGDSTTENEKVYAYRLSDGERQSDKDIEPGTEIAEALKPSGIWSDGEIMWIGFQTGSRTGRFFAYRLSDGVRQPDREFDAVSRPGTDDLDLGGIWSDGTVLWNLDIADIDPPRPNPRPHATAYRLSDGLPMPPGYNFFYDVPAGLNIQHMWSDGQTAWITYSSSQRLRAYSLPVLPSDWAAPLPPARVWGYPHSGGVQVWWSGSPSGAIATDGYTAAASPGGKTCSTNDRRGGSVLVEARPYCTISGLTNGTSYTFTVVSRDEWGASAPSAASAPIRPPGGKADPPVNVRATVGDGTATVSWDPPADDGGSPITGYSVESSPHNRACHTRVADPAPDLTCEVSNLTNGTRYTFEVLARNRFGTSRLSASSPSVTPIGADPPHAPTAVRAQPSNDGTVTLYWTAPSYYGDSPITGYTATATPTETSHDTATCTADGTGTWKNCAFEDLSAETDYKFSVTATNANGTSPAASPAAAVRPCTHTPVEYPSGDDAPRTPRNVNVSGRDDTTVAVRWTSDSSALNVDTYTATATPCGHTCTTRDRGGGVEAATTCEINTLTKGVSYTFTVTAGYNGDYSPQSAASLPFRPPWNTGIGGL